MVGDFGYAKFKASVRGQDAVKIISENISEIEVLAKHGIAPIKAVDSAFADHIKEQADYTNTEKQHIGRIVFEILGMHVWEVSGRQEFPGKVFVSGSTFVRRSTKKITIRRKDPRPGGDEFPIRSAGGYQLVRPGLSPEERTSAINAVSVQRLEEALPLLDAGYHIRMGRKGVRPSLIAKDSLIIE